MPNIDEQVVKMSFDNQQFEKGVSQSLKTIQDLKKSLEFDKMSDSLQNIERVSNVINSTMTDLTNSAHSIANVFTPLGRVVNKVLDDMANKALNAAKNFASLATGMQGIDDGKKKYEEYTKAVQTITNATGKSVKDVSKTLDVLAKYTDETSYDFSEMVKSIGKFTSVGIGLEKAEAAMEGIANWAAKSGAGKQEANRAMYNISQAMGAGAMKLIDWKSIENANMATKEFKEVAIQTAEAMGTLAKGSVTYQNFNETLKNGWLTADVLTTVLAKYSDTTTDFGLTAFKAAQEALTFTDALEALKDAISSGWMRSMEAMFGNLDEARVMWTNVANGLIEFAEIFSETRNELLQGWHELGGYNVMVEAASNVWQTFMNVVLGVKEALENVFPPATAENLLGITNKIKRASDDLLAAFGIDQYNIIKEEYQTTIDFAKELTEVLNKGAKGKAVENLQGYLVRFRYLHEDSDVDGIYGPKTEAAIKKLQKDLGVEMTGNWDKATQAAVTAQKKFTETMTKTRDIEAKNIEQEVETYKEVETYADKIKDELKRGVKSGWTKDLQRELIKAGYLRDKSGADGIFGPKTEEALKKLQKELGVKTTGIWDEQTRKAAETSKYFKIVVEKTRYVNKEVQGLTGPMSRLQTFVKGFASAVKIAIGIAKGGIKLVVNVLHMFDPLINAVSRLASMFSHMFINVSNGLDRANTFNKWANGLTNLLQPLADLIQEIAVRLEIFMDYYAEFLYYTNKQNNFVNFFDFLIYYLKNNTILGPFIDFVTFIVNTLIDLKDKVVSIVGDIVSWIQEKLGGIFNGRSLTDIIKDSQKHNGFIAALFNIYAIVRRTFTSIGEFMSQTLAMIFGDAFVDDPKKTGTAKVLDKIAGIATVAANTISIALVLITQAVSVLLDLLGPLLIPALLLTIQIISNMSSIMAKGGIKSIPDFFIALGKSFAQTELGSKILKSISENVEAFVNKIHSLIHGTVFEGLFDFIKERWKSLVEFLKFEDGKGFMENIQIKLGQIRTKIHDTIEKIKNDIKEAFPNLYTFIQTEWGLVKSLFSFDSSKSIIDNINEKLSTLKDIFITLYELIKTKVLELGGVIKAAFTPNADGSIPIINALRENVPIIDSLVSWFEGVRDRIVSAWHQITGTGMKDGEEEASGGILKIFENAAVFLSALSKMNIGKFIVPAIGALIGYQLLKGVKAIRGITENVEKSGFIGALIGGDDDKEEGFSEKFARIAKSIVAISLSLGLLSMLNYTKVAAGVIAITTIMVALYAVAKRMKENDLEKYDVGEQIKSVGEGIFAIVKSLLLMAGIMYLVLSNGKIAASFVLGAAMIGGILAALAFIQVQISKHVPENSDVKYEGIKEMCQGVVDLVISLAMLTAVIKASGDPGPIMGAFIIIEAMVGTLGLIGYFLTKNASKNENGKAESSISGFVSLCAGVVILVNGLAKLVKVVQAAKDWKAVLAAFLMIEALTLTLGGIVFVVSKFGKEASHSVANGVMLVATAISMCLVIEALVKGIKAIKDVNPETLKWFAAAVGVGMLALVGAVAVFAALDTKTFIGELGFIGLCVALGIGVGILGAIAAATLDNFTKVLQTVGLRLKNFSYWLQGVDWDAIDKAEKWLEKGPQTIIEAIKKAGTDTDTALNIMYNIWYIGITLRNYADMISEIGSKGITGSILALTMIGFAQQIATEIEKIEVPSDLMEGKLSLLGAHLLLYATMLDNIPDTDKSGTALSMVENASGIAGAMNTITLNDNVEKTLVAVGAALSLYYQEIAKIGKVDAETGEALADQFDPKDIEIDSGMITAVMKGLADAVDADDAKKIQSYKKEGEIDLYDVSLGIEALGTALGSYGTHIGTLTTSNVTNANSTLQAVKDLDQYLKDTKVEEAGDYLNTNESRISAFSGNIVTLGVALGKYGFFIGGLTNTTAVNNANLVLEEFMKLNDKLEGKDKGILASIFSYFAGGDNNTSQIQNFASNISAVGQNIGTYAEEIGKLKFGKVMLANTLMQHIANLANEMPKLGGFVQAIEGEQNIATYSDSIATLGLNLVNFQDAVNAVGSESEPLKAENLEEAFKVMERIMSWGKEFFDGQFIKDYDTGNYVTSIELVVKGVTQAVRDLATLGTQKFGSTSNFFTDWFVASNDGDGEGAFSILSKLGSQFMQGLGDGLKEAETGENVVSNAIKESLTTALGKLTDVSEQFKTIGQYICDGIVLGIQEGSGAVETAIRNLATENTIKPYGEETEVNSPSRKFEWFAQMCALGLKVGFDKYAYLVTDSTMDIGKASVDEIAKSFSKENIDKIPQAALDTIKALFIEGHEGIIAGQGDWKIAKEMLAEFGYLDDASASLDEYREALVRFKEEVIGIENPSNFWGRNDAPLLYNVINDQLKNDGSYSEEQYKREIDSIKKKSQKETKTNTTNSVATKKYTSSKKSEATILETVLSNYIDGKKGRAMYNSDEYDTLKKIMIGAGYMKNTSDSEVKKGFATLKSELGFDPKEIWGYKQSMALFKRIDKEIDYSDENNKWVKAELYLAESQKKELEKANKEAKKANDTNKKETKEYRKPYKWQSDDLSDYKNPILDSAGNIISEPVKKTAEEIKQEAKDVTKNIIKPTKKIVKSLNKTIKRGNTGSDVKELQQYLNTLPSTIDKLAVDGIFGPKTMKAVKEAQKYAGVNQTGVWDQQTNEKAAEKLYEEQKKTYKKEVEAAKEKQEQEETEAKIKAQRLKEEKDFKAIVATQRMLLERGYLKEGMFEWGEYNDATKAGLRLLNRDVFGSDHYTESWYDQYDSSRYEKYASKLKEQGGLDTILQENIGSTKRDHNFRENITKQTEQEAKTSEDVAAIQEELSSLGYLEYLSYTPGEMNKATQKAIDQLYDDLTRHGITMNRPKQSNISVDKMIEVMNAAANWEGVNGDLEVALQKTDEARRQWMAEHNRDYTEKDAELYLQNQDTRKKNKADRSRTLSIQDQVMFLYGSDIEFTRNNRTGRASQKKNNFFRMLEDMGYIANGDWQEGRVNQAMADALNKYLDDALGTKNGKHRYTPEKIVKIMKDTKGNKFMSSNDERKLYEQAYEYGDFATFNRLALGKEGGPKTNSSGFTYESDWMQESLFGTSDPKAFVEQGVEKANEYIKEANELADGGAMDQIGESMDTFKRTIAEYASGEGAPIYEQIADLVFGEGDPTEQLIGAALQKLGPLAGLTEEEIGEFNKMFSEGKIPTDAILSKFADFFNIDKNTLAQAKKNGVGGIIQVFKGMLFGANENKDIAAEAGKTAADAVNDAFTEAEKIESPSKVWEGFGLMLVSGLANGIVKAISEADGDTNKLVNTLGGTLKNGVVDFANALQGKDGAGPIGGLINTALAGVNSLYNTITGGAEGSINLRPVVDAKKDNSWMNSGYQGKMSNGEVIVTAAGKLINHIDYLRSDPIPKYATGMIKDTATAATSSQIAQTISAKIKSDTETIQTRIQAQEKAANEDFNQVKTQIDSMKTDIRNLKLYLDGDKLVGGIIDRVDAALGRRGNMTRRLN